MNRTKFLSAEDAAPLIKSGDTVAVSGNGAGMTSAEAILAAIETRFLQTGEPRDLSWFILWGLAIATGRERIVLRMKECCAKSSLRTLPGRHACNS